MDRPAGYLFAINALRIETIPNWHRSFVAVGHSARRVERTPNHTDETYPVSYWPGDRTVDHLEFALKYDGINLATLSIIFDVLEKLELQQYIEAKPTGKYARKLWFLYEFLTGKTLSLADLKHGNYVDLLEPDQYYTVAAATRGPRQRINNNLLGTVDFCPVIRRTDTLTTFDAQNFAGRCRDIIAAYPEELLKRALSFLYSKETKSSFEIERITPGASRTERFIAQLERAETEDFCDKPHLIDLQNRIVDPRFADSDYRDLQNYIGESITIQRERIHYVCPKPEDVPSLMHGLIETHLQMDSSDIPAPVHAAAVAWGFVYIHPFEDGNGRIHRFLIHNILARRGFTPNGLMFPISAAMLKHPADYDASLEALSKPLLALVDYSLDDNGEMLVENRTDRWYRFIDLTTQVEALYRFIEQTIETELSEELEFLTKYDEAKRRIQDIVDMPDRKIDLLIRLCLQNSGTLSDRKRVSEFPFLTDTEIHEMEKVMRASFNRRFGGQLT